MEGPGEGRRAKHTPGHMERATTAHIEISPEGLRYKQIRPEPRGLQERGEGGSERGEQRQQGGIRTLQHALTKK